MKYFFPFLNPCQCSLCV